LYALRLFPSAKFYSPLTPHPTSSDCRFFLHRRCNQTSRFHPADPFVSPYNFYRRLIITSPQFLSDIRRSLGFMMPAQSNPDCSPPLRLFFPPPILSVSPACERSGCFRFKTSEGRSQALTTPMGLAPSIFPSFSHCPLLDFSSPLILIVYQPRFRAPSRPLPAAVSNPSNP